MTRILKLVVAIAVVAAGLLAFAPNAAQAQNPAYGYGYVYPFANPPFGAGTFYNRFNYGYSYPYLPSYMPWGSYYNYVNSGPWFYGYGPGLGSGIGDSYAPGAFGYGPLGYSYGYRHHGYRRYR